MPRITKPLSAREVSEAKPKEKEYNLSDGQGLHLRVKPSGKRVWIFNYFEPFTKRRRNLTLGTFPDLSLALAREKRDANRKLLAQDIDPISHRDEQFETKRAAANNTFKAVAERWIEIHRTKVKPDTANKIWRSLENDVFPRVGSIPIEQLTAPKAIEVIQTLTKRNSFEMARKVARRMNNVMSFAVNVGIVHHNPLTGINQMIPSSRVKNMPTLAPDELPELMRALNFANIKYVTRCLIEWQLHTMVRPGEAVQARWQEIDFDKEMWAIPAERMKMGRSHEVPLTKQSLALLEFMQPLSGHREFIFPSDRAPLKHANKETANMALKRMGFEGRLVAHGLRALASTTLNEQGFDKDVIEVALAHIDKDKIRGAYNRATYIKQRREMMEWWSEHIETASRGSLSLLSATKKEV
ncbi:integrase domain-containing protein [Idiomarina ramblicola]|uniref:Integrase n=1 Tax=Idiomarina ramblicola TaxID=263724 RepID=A0A432Z168_9GAMM|nr:integrase domain-containing protein [Idiomarina ramblicola]RUO71634.1 integrase [Idiomarina ramblicola]